MLPARHEDSLGCHPGGHLSFRTIFSTSSIARLCVSQDVTAADFGCDLQGAIGFYTFVALWQLAIFPLK